MARRQLIPATPLRGGGAAALAVHLRVELASLTTVARDIDKVSYDGRRGQETTPEALGTIIFLDTNQYFFG